MSKAITKKIGNNEFRITRIPPFEAIELMGDLQRVFGPSIASLAAVGRDKELLNQPGALSGVLMDAAEALGRNLDGKALRYLVEALIRPDAVFIKPNGKGDFVQCDAPTASGFCALEDILEVAVLVLQHNYSDFFSKAVARIGSGLTKYGAPTMTATQEEEEQAQDRSPLDD